MTSAIFLVTFVFCAAIVVAAILISHELVETYDAVFCKHYFYYLTSFFAFATYGIWGQIVVRPLLSLTGSGAGTIDAVANILPVLGVPFLFVSWLMLINMAHSMFGSSARQRRMLVHAAIFLSLILGVWAAFAYLDVQTRLTTDRFRNMEASALIGLEALYFAAFLTIVFRARRAARDRDPPAALPTLALLLALAFALRSAMLPMALAFQWFAPVALLVYYGSNLGPLIFLKANADQTFEPVKAEGATDDAMSAILDECGITRREREIVREICRGKTNQQIADDLFISLQTVKDHTHRIYSKMGVRSRVQLVQKVVS